jgi:hypothetical protein
MVALAACAVIAALVWVTRGGRVESSLASRGVDAAPANGARRAADGQGGPAGAPGEPRPWAAGGDTTRRAAAGASGGNAVGGRDTQSGRSRLAVDATRSARVARDAAGAPGQMGHGALPDGAAVGVAGDDDARAALHSELADHAARGDTHQAAADPNAAAADELAQAPPEVAYDGGADHTFSTDAQVEVPDVGQIGGEAGTISFWLRPGWEQTSQDDATFVQLGDSGLQIVKNVNFLRFEYTDTAGADLGLGTNISEWPTGEWRQVTTTWNHGNVALYVDGKLISQGAPQLPEFPPETRLYVGSNYPGNTPVAPGEVSYLTVLNRSTSAGEISSQFQSGPRPRN